MRSSGLLRSVVLVAGLVAACADPTTDPRTVAGLRPVGAVAAATPQLVINEFIADPNAVSDDAGEWFEVHNWGSTSINLLNYKIASDNDPVLTISSSVTVPAGGFVVLARNGMKKRNGGVTVNYAYGTTLTLANAGDWLAIRDPNGVTVDSVAWTSTTAGVTWGVRDPSADNATVGSANWQLATSTFGAGDKGTPGAQNNGYVAPPPPQPVSVAVTPAAASIAVGATQQFAAQAYDGNGNALSTTFTWTSSNTAVATVGTSGLATGQGAGSATITATAANGVAGTAALTVTSGGGSGGGAELIVRVLDIGQGDANYIENGTSKVFIDGGPSAARMGVILDSLGLNGSTINAVILSHVHADHLAGLQELFRTSRNITINYFFENKDVYSSVGLATLRDSINARVSRGQLIYRDTDDPCVNGQPLCTLFLNGGARLHVMRPDPAGSTANNRSTPVKLVGPDSASFSMWFAGDAEQEAIGWFLNGAGYATSPGMKVNVLKADHHGSCNGVTNAYMTATRPDWVTASLSVSNSYGHMHTQAKDLFRAHGKPWYRTDQNGTIVFRTPGTLGGGYTATVLKGSASMDGPPDGTSAQAQCNPVP